MIGIIDVIQALQDDECSIVDENVPNQICRLKQSLSVFIKGKYYYA